jgi:hypothetical protein
LSLNNSRSTKSKINEFYHEGFFSDLDKSAIKLCNAGNYAGALKVMSKKTGIYANHFQMYVMQKMGRDDLAKQIRDFTISEYDGYFGSPPYVSVHKLFLELQLEKELKRELTMDEQNTIHGFLDNVCASANTVNNHRVLFDTASFPNSNLSSNIEKLVRILSDKNRLEPISTINKKPKKLSYTKLVKMMDESPTKKEDSQYLDYISAKKFISNLNLKSENEWMTYCVTGKKPTNIPNNPRRHYSSEWKDWDDWLGLLSKKYLSFNDAKKTVSNFELESRVEWTTFCKTSKLPVTIPAQPQKMYDEWIDWDDWLGTKNREYLPYSDAHEIISKLNFEIKKDWTNYCKSGNKSKTIPVNPDEVYQNEWEDWGDWFGVSNREYLSYQETKQFLFDYGIESWEQWKEFRDSDKRPKNIPHDPYKIYQSVAFRPHLDKHDFYGLYDHDYLSYVEATTLMKKMNFKDFDDYKQWITSDKRPKNIPLEPWAYYEHELGRAPYRPTNTPLQTKDDKVYWHSWDTYLGLK